MKVCSRCCQSKCEGEFSKSGEGDRLRAYCRVCAKDLKASWYLANKAKVTTDRRAWTTANREKERARDSRRRADPKYRVHANVSRSLRRQLFGAKGSTDALLGFSVKDDLVPMLERQFTKGMSWANYGAWHIDHIVPLSSFTVTGANDPEMRRAWAPPNLRPMWATDNLSKHAKRTHLL